MPGVLERRGEDMDLWWWWGWRCLGERERRWRGLGVEDGYGRRGEREGEVETLTYLVPMISHEQQNMYACLNKP